MTTNVSGLGLALRCIASVTFPIGFPITTFSEDADPLDIPSVQVTDVAMGVNGDLIAWNKPNPLKLTLNVVPGSDDDINLQILLEANRSGKGKKAIRDVIQLVGEYGNGRKIIFMNGVITDGNPGDSVSSSGRIKTKAYMFAFENRVVS